MRPEQPLISRRGYLHWVTMAETGASYFAVKEAVASTAIEHPEWDMDEMRTFPQWKEELGR